MVIDTRTGAIGRAQRGRGTTNGNVRGGSDDRRRRREWLVMTYRADVDVIVLGVPMMPVVVPVNIGTERAQPACRCYRCGKLLTVDTVTVDRIVPGALGGTYKRSNIRPCCSTCNASTGPSIAGELSGGSSEPVPPPEVPPSLMVGTCYYGMDDGALSARAIGGGTGSELPPPDEHQGALRYPVQTIRDEQHA